jgi:hypothetical protein
VDSLELVGDLIQDLTGFLSITHWGISMHFPNERIKLESSLENLSSLDNSKQAIVSDMANITNTIKKMLILAEDARTIGEFELMGRYYHTINDMNQDLLRENIKRIGIQNQMKKEGHVVRRILQQCSLLHPRSVQSAMIQKSRSLLKEKCFSELIKLMKLK